MTYHSYKRIVSESAVFLAFMSLLSIFSGYTLESNLQVLLTYPVLLLVLPAFIGASGNLAGTFSARLTQGTHLEPGKALLVNAKATLLLALLFYLVLGFAGFGVGAVLGMTLPTLERFILIIVIGGVLVVLLSVALAVWTAGLILRHRLDPDNFEAPLLSTFADLAGVLILITISRTVLGV